jgi:hypothetical protein
MTSWAILRIRHKKYAPYTMLLFLAIATITTLLQTLKKVPEFMLDDDLKGEEYKIIASLICINGVNYTTFQETISFYVIFVAPAMYLNRKYLAELQFDPYTG